MGEFLQPRSACVHLPERTKDFLAAADNNRMDREIFEHDEELMRVCFLGREMEMPAHNSILRGLQFAVPRTAALYRQFCWNGTCNNCRIMLRNGGKESPALACRTDACDGMDVTSASSAIQRLL